MPLDSAAVQKQLAAPDFERVRIEAQKIIHPLLKPVEIDFVKGLSPEAVGVLAVVANPGLRAVRDRKGIADAQLIQAGILPNPALSYDLNFPTAGNTNGTVNAFGFGLDWDVAPLLKRGAEKDAARANLSSIELDIAWKEWQVAQDARLHVYRIQFGQEQIALIEAEERELQVNYDAVKTATDQRNMTIIDLNAAESALRDVQSSLIKLRQKTEEERLALNKSLGFPPDKMIPLQLINEPLKENALDLNQIMQGIEDRRLDLLALRIGYESQEDKLRAAVRAQFPKIKIGVTHARDTTNVTTTGFTVAIDLPIFDRNQGQIAIEEANRKQLYDEYLNRVYETRAEAAKILSEMKSVQEEITVDENSLPALKSLVENYRKAEGVKDIDILTYYSVRRKMITTELSLLSLKLNLEELQIALEIASGQYRH